MTALRWRRTLAGALLLGAAAAALAAGGPDALLGIRAAAADSTEVAVAMVVDFGTGSSQGVLVGCVKVPAGSSGYQALASFVGAAGLSDPTYNQAGLLCSIGGVPASGCGVPSGSQYIFWSYFHGTGGSWQYSPTGAFTLSANDVEGWRFQNPGPDNPSAPPPEAAPAYASICPAADQPGATPATPPATASAPGTGVGGASALGAAPGAGAPGGANPATSPPVTDPAASTAAPATPLTTAPSPPSSAPSTAPSSAPSSAPGAGSGARTAGRAPTVHHVPESLGATGAPGTGGSAWPLLAGGLLVALLGTGAVVLWRRRVRAP